LRRPELETAFYDSARIILENKVKAEPLDFWFRVHLSTAYAGLGRKEEAIREGKKAIELNPETKDGFGALLNLENLDISFPFPPLSRFPASVSTHSGIPCAIIRVLKSWSAADVPAPFS
jgi:hypothetical protein